MLEDESVILAQDPSPQVTFQVIIGTFVWSSP